MGGLWMWLAVLGVVVAAGVVWWLARSASRRTPPPASQLTPPPSGPALGGGSSGPAGNGTPAVAPTRSAADETWSRAVSDASVARPQFGGGPGTGGDVLSREALLHRDRTLDPSRWDNRPDGTEEYDDGEAPPPASGPTVVDSSFFDSLRRSRDEA